eukprot:GHUV01011359.1.p2 GENE.GHUV01011359.1~~GHUV01011359.1.p2  ORF type:complete len:128 (+),score=41.19 GHUV01011359.1:1303-1686(+)
MISSNFPTVQIADYFSAAIQYLQQYHPAYKQSEASTEDSKALNGRAVTSKAGGASKVEMCMSPKHTWSMTNFLGRQVIALTRRRVLRTSWDDISRSRGMYLLTDQIHMNDTAAGLMAQVLLPYVKDL